MATSWATQSDVESILSPHGVASMADDDDDGTGDAGIVSAMLERASALMIEPKIARTYILSETTSNDFLKWAQATIAACMLSARRNMPAPSQLESDQQQILDFLDQVRQGRERLPNQPDSFDYKPTVSNMKIQRGHRMPARVVQQISTGNAPHPSIRRFYESRGYRGRYHQTG